jgi:ABC-2 type transport system permease protein
MVAATIGAAFAIGIQIGAILSLGTMAGASGSRFAVLEGIAPDPDSFLWWPARAALGQPLALLALLAAGGLALAAAIRIYAPRFGGLALATANVPLGAGRQRRPRKVFRSASPARTLRRKEWTLLLRDPWLISQTLMQLLYLLPAVFILWRDLRGGGATPILLVPVLVLAAGQLGGGLAWLAVSGEDAHDLIATAPVSAGRVLRAKAEAVLGGILFVFAPFGVALAFVSVRGALAMLAGAAIAAGSSTAIQYWFRTQARRSLFRRRQTSSRIATFAEALSSTGWAGTSAMVAAGNWLAIVPGLLVLGFVGCVWAVSPSRKGGGG